MSDIFGCVKIKNVVGEGLKSGKICLWVFI